MNILLTSLPIHSHFFCLWISKLRRPKNRFVPPCFTYLLSQVSWLSRRMLGRRNSLTAGGRRQKEQVDTNCHTKGGHQQDFDVVWISPQSPEFGRWSPCQEKHFESLTESQVRLTSSSWFSSVSHRCLKRYKYSSDVWEIPKSFDLCLGSNNI